MSKIVLYIILVLTFTNVCFSQFTPKNNITYPGKVRLENNKSVNNVYIQPTFSSVLFFSELNESLENQIEIPEKLINDSTYIWKNIKNKKWSKENFTVFLKFNFLNESIKDDNGKPLKDSNGELIFKTPKQEVLIIYMIDEKGKDILELKSTQLRVRRYFDKLIKEIINNK
jgi:hypothetical protein